MTAAPLPLEVPDADAGALTAERPAVARRILFEAAFLGVLADSALRNAPGGLGWTLFVAGLALAALNVARHRGLALSREQRLWLVAALACAAAFSWHDSDELAAANVLGTLVALAMFGMSATGLPAPSILVARVRDVLTAGVYAVRDIAFGAPVILARDAELHALPAIRGGTAWTALRAIVLTAPLVLVFAVLLSRADPVFGEIFALPAIDPARIVSHAFLTGVFAWWSAGLIRGALLGVANRGTLPDEMPVQLGAVEVTTTLGAVIALFAVFVALQVRWLFGGADVVLATTGLTVAEYARTGFFELVAVSVLVLPLILGTRALVTDERVAARHRRLSLALLALLAAIMASALLRMALYVRYFGLTTDRLYATALMAWLAMVFLSMALTVLRGWARPFAATAVLSGFATLYALSAVNPEQLVARVNLARPATARAVDYSYLSRLSGDATPAVVAALAAADPAVETCRAANTLRQRWLRDDLAWNLAARSGRASVERQLTPAVVHRLCSPRR